MAGVYQQPMLFISEQAGENFVLDDRYKLVGLTADGVKKGTGKPIGVLYSMSAKDTAVKVLNKGIAITKVGTTAIAKGADVAMDTDGTAKTAATGDVVVGIAQEAGKASGLMSLLLTL